MTDEQVARICHDANRAHSIILGEGASAPIWFDIDQAAREGAIEAVGEVRSGEVASSERLHELWMASKLRDCWTLGPVKDSTLKTHPRLLPFSYLTPGQREKDTLFLAICQSFPL